MSSRPDFLSRLRPFFRPVPGRFTPAFLGALAAKVVSILILLC
jgi:hypothetical protein